jgi:hypothetical protein
VLIFGLAAKDSVSHYKNLVQKEAIAL